MGFPAVLVPPQGSGNDLEYSDKGIWNPTTKVVLFYGGAHCGGGSCPGSDEIIQYSETTNTWTNLPNSSLGTGHTYQHPTFDPSTQELYTASYNSTSIHKFTTSWTLLTSVPVGSVQITHVLQHFPELSSLIFVNNRFSTGVWRYHLGTSTWTQLATQAQLPGLGPYHIAGNYSPVHHAMIFGGGNNSTKVWKLDSAGVVSSMPDAPVPYGPSLSSLTYDPVSGDFLIVNGTDGTVYAQKFAAGTWSSVSGATAPYRSAAGGALVPISTHGVVMAITNTNIYLYKHSPSTPPPPDKSPAPPIRLQVR